MTSSRPFFAALRLSSLLVPLLLSACSSSDSETGDPSAGGSGGQAGGSTGGTGGKASAGAAGNSSAGAGGSTGGAAGHTSAGAGGSVGGTSAGSAGASGQAGASGKIACEVTNDCAGFIPDTKPAGCAKAVCDAQKFCRFVAKDLDSDGDPSNTCASQDASITIELGGDCDDGDDTVSSRAWDGPKGTAKGESQPNRCDDGVDNNCNGTLDDDKLDDGTSCKCNPGDIRKCSEDSAGKPITFPGGTPVGLCAFGNQTCSDKGKWGECTGAVAPAEEECNGKDDDCDGQTDEDDAKNKKTWLYDNDGDAHAPVGWVAVKQCNKPEVCPAEWPECTDPSKWLQDLPADDCDDKSADIRPGITETCDGIDNNCVNGVDEGCVGQCKAGEQKDCGTALQLKGKCASGFASCLPTGAWGPCSVQPAQTEVCNQDQIAENCNGAVNEGCTCLSGETKTCGVALQAKGKCASGHTTCLPTGVWGPCDVQPATELCDMNKADENCNGTSNENCPCNEGDKQSCGIALNAKGVCAAGQTTCQLNGTWGSCSITPQPSESCQNNQNDENCNGQVNENCKCIEGTTVSCPPPVGCNNASGTCSNGVTGAVSNCKGYNCPVQTDEQAEWTVGSNGHSDGPSLGCEAGYHMVGCEVTMKDSKQGWKTGNITEWWGQCDSIPSGNTCHARAAAGFSYYANCRVRISCQGG